MKGRNSVINPIIQQWLDCWQTGQIDQLPIGDDFQHTSPFGTIKGKRRYLEVVNNNLDDFLNNTLTVVAHIAQGDQVCVQFEQTNAKTGLKMTVCEWYQLAGNQIRSIRSFYNVGNAVIQG